MKLGNRAIVVLSVTLGVISTGAVHVKGSTPLDAWTFDQIVNRERNVLVKFDKNYPYGDKEDAFKELCKRLGEAGANLLVGVVGVEEYGDKLNQDLADRFGVKNSDFPVYKLFQKDQDKPLDYTGEITADALSAFVVEHGGVYLALPGQLKAFDELALKFMAASTERAAIQAETQVAAEALSKPKELESGKYYALVMKRIAEKGDGFVASETARVKKVSGGQITPEKKELFGKRLNILSSFKVSADKKEL